MAVSCHAKLLEDLATLPCEEERGSSGKMSRQLILLLLAALSHATPRQHQRLTAAKFFSPLPYSRKVTKLLESALQSALVT